jgi:hypothetical protein
MTHSSPACWQSKLGTDLRSWPAASCFSLIELPSARPIEIEALPACDSDWNEVYINDRTAVRERIRRRDVASRHAYSRRRRAASERLRSSRRRECECLSRTPFHGGGYCQAGRMLWRADDSKPSSNSLHQGCFASPEADEVAASVGSAQPATTLRDGGGATTLRDGGGGRASGVRSSKHTHRMLMSPISLHLMISPSHRSLCDRPWACRLPGQA